MLTQTIQVPVCKAELQRTLRTRAIYFDHGYFGERGLRLFIDEKAQQFTLMRLQDNFQGLAPGFVSRFVFVFKNGYREVMRIESSDGRVPIDDQFRTQLRECDYLFVEVVEPKPEPVPHKQVL